MTPEQAERLRDLFYEARKTALAADRAAMDSAASSRAAYAADDAAVEAFNTALREATR